VGFESTIPGSERAKTVHALDRWATVTGNYNYTVSNIGIRVASSAVGDVDRYVTVRKLPNSVFYIFQYTYTCVELEVRIKEHKYNLTQGLLEKSNSGQRVYEEGHSICWEEAKGLQTEPNTTYRKYKESAHMSLVDHPISQPSLDISPVWTPVITAEVRQLHLRPV
jgi:hypothetical protein